MNEKEKAEIAMSLAKTAYERYDKHAQTSWHLRLAVWTAFGLATWFVLSSEKWKPKRLECVAASVIAAGIVLVVVFLWSPFAYHRNARYLRVAEYWESVAEDSLGEKLPEPLRPASLGTGGHVRRSQGSDPEKPLDPWYHSPLYLSQALITAMFGLLMVGAIFSKTDWRSARELSKAAVQQNQPTSKVVEQSPQQPSAQGTA